MYLKDIYIDNTYISHKIFIEDLCDKNEFINLIVTGKNGSGKTTFLSTLYREILLYSLGYKPFNLNLRDDILFLENEISDYSYPKVEINLLEQNNFDNSKLSDEIFVVYIPTERIKSNDKGNNESTLNIDNLYLNYSVSIGDLRSNILNLREILKNQESIAINISELKNKIKTLENEYNNLRDPNIKGAQIININQAHFYSNEIEEARIKLKIFEDNILSLQKQQKEKENQNRLFIPNFSYSNYFIQFLLDYKKRQAYAYADKESIEIEYYDNFFNKVEKLFQDLYEDSNLKLDHKYKDSNFYFIFNNGLKVNFENLSHGFKSVLNIIAEILINEKVHSSRTNKSKFDHGIILIDELEAHLHISLQEKILPTLTNFFPNYQFIIATHSPQIIASEEKSYVLDLSSHIIRKEFMGGISYDVISKQHFGLKSEYSVIARKLLEEVKDILDDRPISKDNINKLNKLQERIEKLSPELNFELSLILEKLNNDKR